LLNQALSWLVPCPNAMAVKKDKRKTKEVLMLNIFAD
jgi:hypothetical protein